MRTMMLPMTLLLVVALCPVALHAQDPPAGSAASGLVVRAGTAPAGATLLDPDSPGWERMPVTRVGLNRTPPLYDTDPPTDPEIPLLEVRLARSDDHLLVRLSWQDVTEDTATLEAMPGTPYETRNRKEQSAATDRFFDAAAVMLPANPSSGGVSPSLQMGDTDDPVTIYYWNAARGPARMEAHGRETTRRTGETFPARAVYGSGEWRVTIELPSVPMDAPLAFAIWNGSQSDRDGRKYFSVWHHLEPAP